MIGREEETEAVPETDTGSSNFKGKGYSLGKKQNSNQPVDERERRLAYYQHSK